MTAVHLQFENRAAAIAALAAAGISAGDDAGADAIPSVAIMPDGARIDVVVAGGGSGVVLAPTGAVKPGPPMDDGSPGPDIPVYQATPGFRMTVVSTGQLPEFPGGETVETGGAVLAAPDNRVPAPETTPAPISDRQFARGLWGEGIITFEECEAFCATGAIPAAMQALIDQLPDDATGAPTPRKEAVIFVRGAKEYRRDHPLVATLGAAFGWSPEQIDARWTAWAAL